MSEYSTICSAYRVYELNDDRSIKRTYGASTPAYITGIDKMVESFNEMKLEKFIGDDDAMYFLGYKIKDKIESIRMKRLSETDRQNYPYVRITVKTFPGALRLTGKVKDFLDDYLSSQFSDGWGESFFYPYNDFEVDGKIIAVE